MGGGIVTKEILKRLYKDFDITCIACQHPQTKEKFPYKIIPVTGHPWGFDNVFDLLYENYYDYVISCLDLWQTLYMTICFPYRNFYYISWCPIDSQTINKKIPRFLYGDKIIDISYKDVDIAIPYSQFGADILKYNYNEDFIMIPLGVDTNKFSPIFKDKALLKLNKALRLEPIVFKAMQDNFVVLSVMQNQSRKDFPCLIEGFKKFNEIKEDSILILITSKSGIHTGGYDLERLIESYGLKNKVIIPENFSVHTGIPEEYLIYFYNISDVIALPSVGEGGPPLPALEARSCNKPALVTNYTATVDYISSPEELIEVKGYDTIPWNNYRWAITDSESLKERLLFFYNKPDINYRESILGLDWNNIADVWKDLLHNLPNKKGNIKIYEY